MPSPPMNDQITLRVVEYGIDGLPVKNKYGVPKRTAIQTRARVKYSTKLIVNRNGDEVNAVLEVTLPPETEVRSGDIVEWVDRFGVPVSGVIETFREVLDFPGNGVYYQKAYTGNNTE